MRVTQNTIQEGWIQNLQGRLSAMDRLNRQVGSGNRVDKPAEDPSGANQIVRIEEVVARNEQYLRNIEEAISVERTTESTLEQVYQRLVRAKSLAVEGANDASDPGSGSIRAMAAEVEGVREGILELVLTKYQGEYLFSGTAGGVPPYGTDGVGYQGDGNLLSVNIGNGQMVPINLPGDRAFRETEARGTKVLADPVSLASDLTFDLSDGAVDVSVVVPAGTYTPGELAEAVDSQLRASGANLGASLRDGALSIEIANNREGGEIRIEDPSGALEAVAGIAPGTRNVFALLDDLQAAMESGDPRAVEGLLGRLDRALESLVSERGQLGSRARNLEFTRDRLQAHNLTSRTLQADIEGVDMAEAIMKLTSEEQAYQTALAAGARIFNISIIDFLR